MKATSKPARPRLAPLKRVADETGIPYTSWRDIIARGEIAFVRVGRATYLEWADVERWITTRKETAA